MTSLAKPPNPRELAAQGHRPVVAGLWLNGLLASIKIAGGIWGHSFALIADGFESLADVFSSAIVYLGLRYSVKPRDQNHPYGHGKAEPLAAAVVGLALVGAGVSIAIETPAPTKASPTTAAASGSALPWP